MGRGKRHHNKDCERVRQQLEQMNKKYKSSTVTRLRENLTESEMEKDFIDIFEKHHNVCKGAFKIKLLILFMILINATKISKVVYSFAFISHVSK